MRVLRSVSLAAALLVSIALPAAAGAPPSLVSVQQPIVNGVNTVDLPSVVLVIDRPTPDILDSCTGTLIGCRTVLTAAHCFCDDTPGSSCHPTGTHTVWFQNAPQAVGSEVFVDPDWDPNTSLHDLAIIRLASPVNGIAPTRINTASRLPPGTPGVIAGFGTTSGNATDGGIKRAGAVRTASCVAGSPSLNICWNFANPIGQPGQDSNTCVGDSGGPLLVASSGGPVVAGVTSFGNADCLAPDNAVDADVFVDRAWIQATAGSDLNATTCGPLPQAGSSDASIISGQGVLGPGNRDDTWQFDVAPGTALLRVALNGEEPEGPDFGGNDFDLAVRRMGSTGNACESQGSGALEFCEVPNPQPGTYFATVSRGVGSGQYQLVGTRFAGASQGPTGPCVPGDTTLCLDNDRFQVKVDWQTNQGTSGPGHAVELTPDTGYFWFFNPSNVEMVLKVLDACSFTDRFWVFAGGLTNVEVKITVTDTDSGVVKQYQNGLNTPFQPIQDTNAFDTCP